MALSKKGSTREAAVRAMAPKGVASKSRLGGISAMNALGVLQAALLVAFACNSRWEKWGAGSPQAAPQAAPAARVLTDETLAAYVAGLPDGVLLNFHSPTCPHCKELAPEFEAAARELKAKGGAPLASVDVGQAPRAAKLYGVQRYPTMLWFRNGEVALELPPTVREKTKIVEYVEWAGQPAVVPFGGRAELDEALPQLRAVLRGGTPPVVAGFGVAPDVLPALVAAAERLRGKLIFVFTEEVREGDPALRAYFHDPGADQDFEGQVGAEAVHAWAKALLQQAKAGANVTSGANATA